MSDDRTDCIVIGSGPAGMACASALLSQGRTVQMLDAGVTIEAEKLEIVHAARDGGLLRPETAPWLQRPLVQARDGIPRKLLFGSDFPFQAAAEHLRLSTDGVGLEPTFAFGGFSTIWGAAVMPYVDRDIEDWPIRARDLGPHYEACARLLGFAAEEDDLAEEFPLYGEPPGQVAPSNQARALLTTMSRNRRSLAAAGVRFGRARVAIRPPGPEGGCVACGLCLHGCPDDNIFNTQQAIRDFEASGRFAYRPGVVIETVSEEGTVARASGYDLRSREPLSFEANRVFIASGAIATTGILLRSGNLYGSPVRLRDSQYFLAPLLTASAVPDVAEERLHTLAQVFLSMSDEKMSGGKSQFLQIYSYNWLLAEEVRRKLGALSILARPFLERLMLVQGYLHSDMSGGIDVVLDGRPGADRLRLSAVLNSTTKPTIKRVMRKLLALAPSMRAVPVAPLIRIAEPGRGFHSGGSFPMQAAPGDRQSDILGRPFGWKRVHAVDATVLPSIAATTITYTVMANAHRIGSAVVSLDAS